MIFWLKDKRTILLIGALGIALRLIASNQSLWLDEAISANVVRQLTYSGILTKFSPSDFHPPLYYFVLKFWSTLFGANELALRSFSIFCGAFSILMIYQIGKKVFSARVGLFAALLLATAPLHIYYSQEARMYALETLLVLTSVYWFIVLLERQTLKRWLVFTIINAALLYTDYLPTFIFDAYLVWLLLAKQDNKWQFIGKYLLSQIAVVCLFIPFVPTFLAQLHLGQQATQQPWSRVLGLLSVKSIGLLATKLLIGRISFDNKLVYGVVVGFTAPFYGGLASRAIATKQRQLWLIISWLVVPVGLGALIALKLSIFDYFRFLFVLPALYLLVAIGLNAIKYAQVRTALFILLFAFNMVFTGIYLFNPKFHREDWRNAVGFIEQKSNNQSLVVFPNTAQADAYTYYASGKVPVGSKDAINSGYTTIWLMRYVQDIYDPQDSIRREIENLQYQKVREYDFNRVIIWQYRKD